MHVVLQSSTLECVSNSSVPGGNPMLRRNRTVTAHQLVTNARVRPTSVLEVQNTHPLGDWVQIRNEKPLLNIRYLQPSLTSKGTGEVEVQGLQGHI